MKAAVPYLITLSFMYNYCAISPSSYNFFVKNLKIHQLRL